MRWEHCRTVRGVAGVALLAVRGTEAELSRKAWLVAERDAQRLFFWSAMRGVCVPTGRFVRSPNRTYPTVVCPNPADIGFRSGTTMQRGK